MISLLSLTARIRHQLVCIFNRQNVLSLNTQWKSEYRGPTFVLFSLCCFLKPLNGHDAVLDSIFYFVIESECENSPSTVLHFQLTKCPLKHSEFYEDPIGWIFETFHY
ncbi:hypothetical protein ACOME3_004926 [Neoechinorhynchus agilis]